MIPPEIVFSSRKQRVKADGQLVYKGRQEWVRAINE
jgi:hypothetical protein